MDLTIHIDMPAMERLAKALEALTPEPLTPVMRADAVEERTIPAPEPKPEPKPEPIPKPEPTPAVDLGMIQHKAAEVRDKLGSLDAITALFPEFGIRKLSDLKGEALGAFYERLAAIGG